MKIIVAFRKSAKAPEMAALLTGRLHSVLFSRHLSTMTVFSTAYKKKPPFAQEIELVPSNSYHFRCCSYAFHEDV
jgi:hypothetical protein